jgi:hypothetical protein
MPEKLKRPWILSSPIRWATQIFYDTVAFRLVVGPFKDLGSFRRAGNFSPLPKLGIASWRPKKKYIATFDANKIRIRIFFNLKVFQLWSSNTYIYFTFQIWNK